MNLIIDKLINLGFTRTEAEVYFTLLEESDITGYQIAKRLNVSRSSVYNSLESLYRKGAVVLIPGEVNIYRPENPEILLDNLKNRFVESSSVLLDEISKLKPNNKINRYINIDGLDNLIFKTKELLKTAKAEVIINTDFDINIFADEIDSLTNKGVRVIVFSFDDLKINNELVEIYSHKRNIDDQYKRNRIMLVIDMTTTLVGGRDGYNTFLGTYTDNKLFTSIVSEHIHHDIYLLKLKQKDNTVIFDDSIKIDSLQEKIKC